MNAPLSPEAAAQAQALAQRIQDLLQPLHARYAEAHWRLSLTGDAALVPEIQTLGKAIEEITADPDRFAALEDLRAQGQAADPLLQRTLDRLYLSCFVSQGDPALMHAVIEQEAELQQLFSTFRGTLDGQPTPDHVIQEILDAEPDWRRRKAAWEASKQVGAHVAGRIRALARLRNEVARARGFRDFFAMSFYAQELDEDAIFDLFDRLDAQTGPAYARLKETLDGELAASFGIHPAHLRPWHYGDPFAQRIPADAGGVNLDPLFEGLDIAALTQRCFADLGMPIDAMLERSDLFPRDGKNQHAFCTDIDRRGDVRVLANIRPSQKWMGTMLHEFGHAVYFQLVDPDLPYELRSYAHILTTESIAMLFGRLAQRADFLRAYVKPDLDEAALTPTLRWREALEMLTLVQWVQVMVRFERALYADPDREDLNDLWWSLVEHHQRITRPDDRPADAADWAAKIHFTIAPVYYQNYLLGEVLASQLQASLDELTGGDGFIQRPEAGQWLRDRVFTPGARYPWDVMIERATGSPLRPDAFIAEFAAPWSA